MNVMNSPRLVVATKSPWLATVALAFVALVGCAPPEPELGTAQQMGASARGCPAPALDATPAQLGEASHTSEGALHTAQLCVPLCFETSPPSSGNHYPTWAAYKTYDAPVPWGFLVHNLEHGAVVVAYNCPEGCAEELAAAKAWVAGLRTDKTCGLNRVILVPDPTLDVRWAASAWRHTWRGKAFDAATLTAFHAAHYDHGNESICEDGVDFSWKQWCGNEAR